MATPAFRHMGGKARLRKWLVKHFPRRGARYIEPFAGKGNVFYLAYEQLTFSEWWLCDLFSTPFLTALQVVDLQQLPETVTRADFTQYATHPEEPIARVIEPRVTFAGKGYRAGYSGSSGTHVGYSGAAYRSVCGLAQTILRHPTVHIVEQPWEATLDGVTPQDFVYCDPPYWGVEANYANIDHALLVDRLNALPCRWALSGYEAPPYRGLLYRGHSTYERNSEIKSSNARERQPVIEHLWTSYSLEH